MDENSYDNINYINNKDNRIQLLIKIKKKIPTNHYFYLFILIPKLLALIVITHEWNINKKKLFHFG